LDPELDSNAIAWLETHRALGRTPMTLETGAAHSVAECRGSMPQSRSSASAGQMASALRKSFGRRQ